MTVCAGLVFRKRLTLFAFPKKVNKLDLFIVCFTIFEIALTNLDTGLGFVKSLRVLRAVRPLRALTKSPGMRLVLKSVMLSIGKYFPITTFRRLIAHTRLTLSFLSQAPCSTSPRFCCSRSPCLEFWACRYGRSGLSQIRGHTVHRPVRDYSLFTTRNSTGVLAALPTNTSHTHCFISNSGDCSDRLPLPVVHTSSNTSPHTAHAHPADSGLTLFAKKYTPRFSPEPFFRAPTQMCSASATVRAVTLTRQEAASLSTEFGKTAT